MTINIVVNVTLFLSTHSVRSATNIRWDVQSGAIKFLSTHSVRSATEEHFYDIKLSQISIHALRKECDALAFLAYAKAKRISIHALRKECDIMKIRTALERFEKFLSTHSVRSATA